MRTMVVILIMKCRKRELLCTLRRSFFLAFLLFSFVDGRPQAPRNISIAVRTFQLARPRIEAAVAASNERNTAIRVVTGLRVCLRHLGGRHSTHSGDGSRGHHRDDGGNVHNDGEQEGWDRHGGQTPSTRAGPPPLPGYAPWPPGRQPCMTNRSISWTPCCCNVNKSNVH